MDNAKLNAHYARTQQQIDNFSRILQAMDENMQRLAKVKVSTKYSS